MTLALLHQAMLSTRVVMAPAINALWLLFVISLTILCFALAQPKLEAWKNVAAIAILLAATVRSFPVVCLGFNPSAFRFPLEGATGLFSLLILQSKSQVSMKARMGKK